MDRMIYVAMTGAKHTLGQQAAMSHNLANANTTGYRAETSVLRAVPVLSDTPGDTGICGGFQRWRGFPPGYRAAYRA